MRKKIKPGPKIGGGNLKTKTVNNIANSIYGHRKKAQPVPGDFGKKIDTTEREINVNDLFVDVEN